MAGVLKKLLIAQPNIMNLQCLYLVRPWSPQHRGKIGPVQSMDPWLHLLEHPIRPDRFQMHIKSVNIFSVDLKDVNES